MKSIYPLISLIAILIGCGRRAAEQPPMADTAGVARRSSDSTSGESRGASIYRSKCSFCHQTGGRGAARMFPPLSGSEYITGDAGMLVRIVLNGMQGPITVRGTRFNNAMPG